MGQRSAIETTVGGFGGLDLVLDVDGLNFSFSDTRPVTSAGVSARVNLLGALVVEAYWAVPFEDQLRDTYFGLQIAPGW